MPRQSRAGKIAGPQVQTATRPRTVTESCPSESGVDPLHFQGDVLFKILSYALWYGHRRLRLMAGPCGPSTAPAVPSTEVNITSVLCPQAEPSRSRMLVGLGRSPVSVLAPYCLRGGRFGPNKGLPTPEPLHVTDSQSRYQFPTSSQRWDAAPGAATISSTPGVTILAPRAASNCVNACQMAAATDVNKRFQPCPFDVAGLHGLTNPARSSEAKPGPQPRSSTV